MWIFVGFALQVQVVASVSHGLALVPRNTGDKRRAELRSSVTLPEGRPVLGRTELHRDRLPGDFDRWLKAGHSFCQEGLTATTLKRSTEVSTSAPPAPAGGDLAYAWVRQEPPCHHLALPWQARLSLVATAKEAGIIALSCGGLTRIGEAF